MTTKEAIKILSREKECVQQALQRCADGSGYVSPDGMIRAADYVEACSVALQALRAQQEQEATKPLTLDELRQMDGEPVWVVCDVAVEGIDLLSFWALVEVAEESIFLTNNLGGRTEYAADVEFEDDGITVYRHKPKETPHAWLDPHPRPH